MRLIGCPKTPENKYQSALRNIPEDRISEPRVLIEQGTGWSPNYFERFGKETSILSLPGVERQSHSPVSTPITVLRRICCAGSEGHLTAIYSVLWWC
jgi:hypothetical protein